jgi:hypothetical protein
MAQSWDWRVLSSVAIDASEGERVAEPDREDLAATTGTNAQAAPGAMLAAGV